MISPIDFGADFYRYQKYDDYTWILAFGIIAAFFTAFGIGANDVANSFGSSVGSKAITIRQAVIIAAVFEFCGAFFLGSSVTDTVRKKIADVNVYIREPELLMFGMMCVIIATGIWLILASYLEMPVSTTHSAVGGVIGMTIALKGVDSVIWNETKDEFPYVGGVAGIVMSWVFSPVLSGAFAAVLFFFVRTTVLRSANSFQRSFFVLPGLVFLAVSVNLMFMIYKGASGKGSDELSEAQIQGISWGVGAGCGVITACFMPLLKKRVEALAEARTSAGEKEEDDAEKAAAVDASEPVPRTSSFFDRLRAGIDHDVHAELGSNARASAVHDHAEVFDPMTEESFKYLQVFTAICDSFAHGANDVANSIGPLAAIVGAWNRSAFDSKVPVQKWVLAVGAVGIVIGLATYGYKIIGAIGVKLSKITASRGFAIELGAAMVIILGSNYGIPLSTTHCQVGATVGVGLLEGTGGVNGWLLLKMVIGWIITLVVVGGTCAAFTAIGAYAPSVQMGRQLLAYEDGLRLRSEAMIYGFEQQAALNAAYSSPELPIAFPQGADLSAPVPQSETFLQWTESEDGVLTSQPAPWGVAWSEAMGEGAEAVDANQTTFDASDVFRLFDEVARIGFAPEQQMQALFARSAELVCDEETQQCTVQANA